MNRPDTVTALTRQLARQQQVIAERDAEIAELRKLSDAQGKVIDVLLDDCDKRDAEIARLQARVFKLEKEQRRAIEPYPSTKPYIITVNAQDLPIIRFAEDDHATE